MIDMLELKQEAYHQGRCWLLEELLQVKRTLAAQVSTSLQRLQHYYIPWLQVSVERRDIKVRMQLQNACIHNTW